MPTKAEESKDDEVVQLRARIKDLEARLDVEKDRSRDRDRDADRDRGRDQSGDRGSEVRASYRDRDDDRYRPRDRRLRGVADAGDRKVETAMRTIRGLTLASVEAVRMVADSFATAADDLLDSSRPRDNDETLRHLSSRFGESLGDSVSDTAQRLMDIPSRSAEQFSRAYNEGDYRRFRDDRDRARDDRPSDRGERDDRKRTRSAEVRVETESRGDRKRDDRKTA